MPYLDKVFFANSGTECVEAAIKFARGATGRTGIVYCDHAYHGLSYGSLSLTGIEVTATVDELPADDLTLLTALR